MALEDRINALLDRLERDASERAMGRKQLEETADAAAFPSELLHQTHLAPPIYNAGTRRFEFERTPNRFPQGVANTLNNDVVTLRGLAAGIAGSGQNTQDLVPGDVARWRVLGVQISTTAAAIIQVREEGGGRLVLTTHTTNQAKLIWLMNGVDLTTGKSLEIWANGVTVCVFTFYVSEETDTSARGSV